MNRTIKFVSLCVIIFLALPSNISGQAASSSTASPPEKSYILSSEALAAAERLRTKPDGRISNDINMVLSELLKVDQTPSADGKVEPQAITKQQLIELIGSPNSKGEKGEITYITFSGSTTIFFENHLLKETRTLIQMNVWYAYPRQSAANRFWYRVVRWSHKLKRLLS